MSSFPRRWAVMIPALVLATSSYAFGEEAASTASQLGYAFDNGMLFLCAILVLFMQAGFAMVEVGLNSAKNTVNILYKNVMDLSVGALLFFLIGFSIMYPGLYKSDVNPYFDFGGLGIYSRWKKAPKPLSVLKWIGSSKRSLPRRQRPSCLVPLPVECSSNPT